MQHKQKNHQKYTPNHKLSIFSAFSASLRLCVRKTSPPTAVFRLNSLKDQIPSVWRAPPQGKKPWAPDPCYREDVITRK